MDLSFRKASKVQPKISRRIIDRLFKKKVAESLKLETASSVMLEQLAHIVKGFPSLDSVDPFYKELADIIIGMDKLREALGGIDGCRQVIKSVTRDHIRRIETASTFTEIQRLRRAAYGRLSSVVKRTKTRLELLADARNRLRKIVSINPNEPTVVVSGAPNVGKSSLVRLISSAKPEVAYYPFTTRSLILGHLIHGKKRIQVLDTPGLLDRPITDRNPLELQAITALRYLAKMILFLYDPTEICGYPLSTQINIFKEIKALFKETKYLVAINKVDLLTSEKVRKVRESMQGENMIVEISALTGKGVDALINSIFETLDKTSGRHPNRD